MDILEHNKFFQRIGLFKEANLLLRIDAYDFKRLFSMYVGEDKGMWDTHIKARDFHGQIGRSAFKIYKPMRSTGAQFASAHGTYSANENAVEITIAAFIPMTTFLLIASLLVVYAIILISMMHSIAIIMALFLGFHVFFSFRIYSAFKRNVNELLNSVEREFGYWLSKENALQQRI